MYEGKGKIPLEFPSVNIRKIMNKEMFEEIKKSFEPKKMTKSEWKIFIKECKEKLKKTECFICDNNIEY